MPGVPLSKLRTDGWLDGAGLERPFSPGKEPAAANPELPRPAPMWQHPWPGACEALWLSEAAQPMHGPGPTHRPPRAAA